MGDVITPLATVAEAVFVLRATATVASGDMLDVRHFAVSERISSLFEVRLIAVSDNPDIDFEAVIGQPMRFTIEGPTPRVWSGVCSQLYQTAVEERNLSTYELTLVPTLWLATQRRNHRIFQQMSEVEIAREVLSEWGITPILRLGGVYRKRKYRVQYGETDHAFFCRMLEDAGVSHYFDGEGESRLVLDDGPQANEPRAPIAFRDHPTDARLEHVTAVRVGRRVRPGKYTVRDHDYRRAPTQQLLASAASPTPVEERLERFHYVPGAFLYESDKGEGNSFADDKGKYRTDDGEAGALAQRRLEAKRASAREVLFKTNTLDPAPGAVLTFVDHPKSELGPDKRLLIVASSITGALPGTWEHACTAVSTEAPYRPPLTTPKPRVQGVESATVVGPAGEEIHVDEHGRVRVHFHWDRQSRMNDASSCWIHVSQPWGGAGFGGSALPRVGQEVIVDFLGGDPDRPVIVGRVYTGLQKTPYALPENKTQSGLKSNSTQGTGGYNEVMFEDLAGSELVRIQAEKDLRKLVKHDEEVRIGHDRKKLVEHDDDLEVGHDRRRLVGNDESVTIVHDRKKVVGHDEMVTIGHDRLKQVGNDDQLQVGNDRRKVIGNDETVNVGRDRVTAVGNDEELTIGNDATRMVQNNERHMVGTNRTRAVGANESVDIGDNQQISIGGAQTITVGDAQSLSVGDSQSINVDGSRSLSVSRTSSETVMLAKSVTVGGALSTTVGAAMTTTVGLIQTENVGISKTVTAGQKIELVCGASKIVLESSGKVTISGTEITIEGSKTKIVGDPITLN